MYVCMCARVCRHFVHCNKQVRISTKRICITLLSLVSLCGSLHTHDARMRMRKHARLRDTTVKAKKISTKRLCTNSVLNTAEISA